jgi:hypothetical protein
VASVNRRITVQSGLGPKQETLSQNNKAKGIEGVAQVRLPSKHKALSSNPSAIKKKKKRKMKRKKVQ